LGTSNNFHIVIILVNYLKKIELEDVQQASPSH